MKNFLLLVVFCSSTFLIAKDKEKKIKNIKIKTSAVCGMCNDLIVNKTLAFEKGVKYAELNLKDGIISIDYKSNKTSPEVLKELIRNLGYRADNLNPDPEIFYNLPRCCQAPGVCGN